MPQKMDHPWEAAPVYLSVVPMAMPRAIAVIIVIMVNKNLLYRFIIKRQRFLRRCFLASLASFFFFSFSLAEDFGAASPIAPASPGIMGAPGEAKSAPPPPKSLASNPFLRNNLFQNCLFICTIKSRQTVQVINIRLIIRR